MKLTIDSFHPQQRFGEKEGLKMIKDAGFDAIDYSFYYKKECEAVLGENYRAYAQDLRAQLDRIGIVCNQAHAPFTFQYGMRRSSNSHAMLVPPPFLFPGGAGGTVRCAPVPPVPLHPVIIIWIRVMEVCTFGPGLLSPLRILRMCNYLILITSPAIGNPSPCSRPWQPPGVYIIGKRCRFPESNRISRCRHEVRTVSPL